MAVEEAAFDSAGTLYGSAAAIARLEVMVPEPWGCHVKVVASA